VLHMNPCCVISELPRESTFPLKTTPPVDIITASVVSASGNGFSWWISFWQDADKRNIAEILSPIEIADSFIDQNFIQVSFRVKLPDVLPVLAVVP